MTIPELRRLWSIPNGQRYNHAIYRRPKEWVDPCTLPPLTCRRIEAHAKRMRWLNAQAQSNQERAV